MKVKFVVTVLISLISSKPLNAQVHVGQRARILLRKRWYVGILQYEPNFRRSTRAGAPDSCLAVNVEPLGGMPGSFIVSAQDSLEIWVPASQGDSGHAGLAPSGRWLGVSLEARRKLVCP
jgi:hypothetical protein